MVSPDSCVFRRLDSLFPLFSVLAVSLISTSSFTIDYGFKPIDREEADGNVF